MVRVSDLNRCSGLGPGIFFLFAPFAGTAVVVLLGELVAGVDGAMFVGVFGFIAAGAAAAVGGGVAVDLLEEGVAAIGDIAADDSEGASFADGGAGVPLGMDAEGADLAEAGGGEFTEGFQEVSGEAGGVC